jgi:hypothetical protein
MATPLAYVWHMSCTLISSSCPGLPWLQVSKQLIELYAACLRNDASVLQQLRQRQATGAAASKKSVVSGTAAASTLLLQT